MKQHRNKNEPVVPHLCIGVQGRGDANETLWKTTKENEAKDETEAEEDDELDAWEDPDAEMGPTGRKLLSLWNGQQLRTTPCQNTGAVLEFFFVPFIVEEPEEEDSAVDANLSFTESEMTDNDEEL